MLLIMGMDTETTSTPTDLILAVSDAAMATVLGIRGEEPDPEALGLRVEVTGAKGSEYTYDLCFHELSALAEDDVTYLVDDLTVIIPADSVDAPPASWAVVNSLPSGMKKASIGKSSADSIGSGAASGASNGSSSIGMPILAPSTPAVGAVGGCGSTGTWAGGSWGDHRVKTGGRMERLASAVGPVVRSPDMTSS